MKKYYVAVRNNKNEIEYKVEFKHLGLAKIRFYNLISINIYPKCFIYLTEYDENETQMLLGYENGKIIIKNAEYVAL